MKGANRITDLRAFGRNYNGAHCFGGKNGKKKFSPFGSGS